MNDEASKPLDPVAEMILDLLESSEKGAQISGEQAAKAMAELKRKPNDGPQLWRRYMNAVKQQAIYLARQERIEITRRGEKVDPNDFKGLWKMRLPHADMSETDA